MERDAVVEIADEKIQHAALTRLYTERINTKNSTAIDVHAEKVKEAISLHGYSSSTPVNHVVKAEMDRFTDEMYRANAREMIEFGNHVQGFSLSSLTKGFGNYVEPERVSRTVSVEIVLKKPIYMNATMKEGWGSLTQAERMRVEKLIREGLSKGLNEEAIIKNVSKAFDLTKVHSEGLVVTGITSVYAQVDQQVYMANSKYLKGYQYVAVLDSRTSSVCRSLDHDIFPVEDTSHLPPQHFRCRSTTIPVPKSWEDLIKSDAVKTTRMRNIVGLTPEQIQAYDKSAIKRFSGRVFPKETYSEWLYRQPTSVQLIHLGNETALKKFQNGELQLPKFMTPKGASIGLRELTELSGESNLSSGFGASVDGTSRHFNLAKERLDALNLGYVSPDDLYMDKAGKEKLLEYYRLQSGELGGTLSLTNYRGILPHVKLGTRSRVLSTPPTDAQLIFNPATKRREDARLYQPNLAVNARAERLISDSTILNDKDKAFLLDFKKSIHDSVGMNEAAVVSDNLRVAFERFRKQGQPWGNMKAVLNSEMKNSLINVSEFMETALRNKSDFFYKIKQDEFLDPVLGPVFMDNVAKNFHKNIIERNAWEVRNVPIISFQIKPFVDYNLPIMITRNIDKFELKNFYQKFVMRLAQDDAPDRDQLAISLGRDLYNLANLRGDKQGWYKLGLDILDRGEASGLYRLESRGTQKRRMRGKATGAYFGQYYDTKAWNLVIQDKRLKRYSELNRLVEIGMRVGVTDQWKNKLIVKPGYKTYFLPGGYDTKIPITSSSGFKDFPAETVDDSLANALNWASQTKYKVDPEFHDFIRKLVSFQDDRGNAKHYNDINHYKAYITARGDSYERFKAMEYYRKHDIAFGSTAFVDHRGRIYDSGYISPQSGESFRPFLNTPESKVLGEAGYYNFRDQVGSFLSGLSDEFEYKYNGLSSMGKQQVYEHWRPKLVSLGRKIANAKPQDIRDALDMDIVQMVEGEEQGKLFRLALETYKIDQHFKAGGTILDYKTALALEQDASSSGAQIIALTTRNKQLAELSNVVPTNQKRRLYDEIASATFQDPRFKKLNERLGLSEKDLRKARLVAL